MPPATFTGHGPGTRAKRDAPAIAPPADGRVDQNERPWGCGSGPPPIVSPASWPPAAPAYRHHVPASVDHLIQRSEFLTSYTPYQPEITQGTLQYLFEFQTQVAHLTAMDVANASMYDGSTGSAEAVLMAHRVTRRKKAVVSGGLHPQYADVIATLSKYGSAHVDRLPATPQGVEDIIARIDGETSCVVLQYPDFFGRVRDLQPIADAAHAKGALLVAVVTEVVALGALKAPGEMGADIVVGNTQRFGMPMGNGGPHAAYLATKDEYKRSMPGRLVGVSVDSHGRPAYRLALQTREQHIRREKATSNICTAQVLLAVIAGMYAVYHGPRGLRAIAERVGALAAMLAHGLERLGVRVKHRVFFDTVRVDGSAADVAKWIAPSVFTRP
jgi:glycine dehydrogenase subunit 1